MFKIKYGVYKFTGTEGEYKTEPIAKRHLRKLQKKYPETKFTIEVKNESKKGGK